MGMMSLTVGGTDREGNGKMSLSFGGTDRVWDVHDKSLRFGRTDREMFVHDGYYNRISQFWNAITNFTQM
jgi:hypothetical protein